MSKPKRIQPKTGEEVAHALVCDMDARLGLSLFHILLNHRTDTAWRCHLNHDSAAFTKPLHTQVVSWHYIVKLIAAVHCQMVPVDVYIPHPQAEGRCDDISPTFHEATKSLHDSRHTLYDVGVRLLFLAATPSTFNRPSISANVLQTQFGA